MYACAFVEKLENPRKQWRFKWYLPPSSSATEIGNEMVGQSYHSEELQF